MFIYYSFETSILVWLLWNTNTIGKLHGPSELEIYMLSFLCFKRKLILFQKLRCIQKLRPFVFFSSSMRVGVFVLLSFTGAPQWVSIDGCKPLSYDPNAVKDCPFFFFFPKVFGKSMGANGVSWKSTGAITPVAPALTEPLTSAPRTRCRPQCAPPPRLGRC